MSAEQHDAGAARRLADQHADVPVVEPPKGLGVRHLQVFLLFISLSIGLSMRAHLSVTLVAMTGPSAHNLTCGEQLRLELGQTNSSEPSNNTVNEDETSEVPGDVCKDEEKAFWDVQRTYDWSKPQQEMILFAFFVGYTSMMLPMGVIAQTFGGKLPICVALAVNGFISIVTPWMPLFGGWVTVCAGRLLQGMTQAAYFPSIHTMLAKWTPLSERGRLSTYVYTGSQFGTILAFQVAGLFAGSPMFGWPSTFWFCGIVSLVCFGLLCLYGAATPSDHPSITAEEFAYITKDGKADSGTRRRKTPWKYILTSRAVWALVASHCGSAFGYLLVFTQIPMYMQRMLGVDIKRNGLYSSLPYISMYFMTLLFGYLSDLAANRGLMTVANIRKTANTIGMVVSGLFLVAFSFVNDTLTAVILLILCMGLHSGVQVGFHINHIDLAPNFAGSIMAVGNMIANLSGLVVPVLVSNIVGNDVTNQSKWQIIFILFASLQFVTNLIFVIFAKGTVQDWNFYGDEKKHDEKEKYQALLDMRILLKNESKKCEKVTSQ